MAFGIGKVLIMPLMVINFGLYFIAACLAGSILNRNLDANMHRNDDIQIGMRLDAVCLHCIVLVHF